MKYCDMSPLRDILAEDDRSIVWLCRKIGISEATVRAYFTGNAAPNIGVLCKMAWFLKVPLSRICTLNDVEYKDCLKDRWEREPFVFNPESTGEVSYQPLRDLVESFCVGKAGKKTPADLFDLIEPNPDFDKEYRKENVRKALDATGRTVGSLNPKQRPGMSGSMRAKLNKDEPVQFYTIWALCKKLGCSIDYVVEYR